MIYTLKNDSLTVKIDTLGAELISVKDREGYEYIWQGDERYWDGHAPVLFPICGRLLGAKYTYQGVEYKMGLHGFARENEFAVKEASNEKLIFCLETTPETFKIYPFNFRLVIQYRLEGVSLFTDFKVENTGECVMPYMLGWHPGFNLWGDAPIGSFYLDFGKAESLNHHPLMNGLFVNPKSKERPLDGGRLYLNEEELYKNDTLIYRDYPRFVTMSNGSDDRYISMSASENLPYFCIWKPQTSEARLACLEPWSGVPADGATPENFDDREMSRLAPGKCDFFSVRTDFN